MIQKFSEDGIMWGIDKIIHESLAGDSVHKMMARALGEVANILNMSSRITRRKGWEDVKWRFDCAGY